MDGYFDRKVVVVEGHNYSGKSTFFSELKRLVPGSVVLEFHDYYHRQLCTLRKMNGAALTQHQINSGDVPDYVARWIIKYGHRRIREAVRYIEDFQLDSFLVERLHVTDLVYRKLLFGGAEIEDYAEAEEKLNEQEAFLVVMAADDAVMKERMSPTVKSERQESGSMPDHLTDFAVMRRKRDMYIDFYRSSRMHHKFLLSSTNDTDCAGFIGSNILCTP